MPRVPHASYLFGQLPEDRAAARLWLADLKSALTYGGARLPQLALNVAFTSLGLTRLGLTASEISTFPAAFQDGMTAPWRSRALGDVERNAPESWRWGGARNSVDFALLVYAKDVAGLAEAVEAQTRRLQSFGGVVVRQVDTPALPPPEQSSPEPFGFEDGLSQPRVRGLRPTTPADADHVVEPGELLLGYPDNSGFLPPSPSVAAIDDPNNLLSFTGGHPNAPHDLGRDGTFLVMRQLRQNVRGFWAVVERNADAVRAGGRAPVPDDELVDWVGAKAVGRWRNGDPLVTRPNRRPFDAATDENDFRYGHLDPAGQKCPFGAHIRRANPRDGFGADPATRLAVANRHRILRVGRPYLPDRDGDDPGLMFTCVNADIERQFEFLQQTWIGNPQFAGLRGECDPLLGAGAAASGRLSIPTAAGPIAAVGFKDFVTVLGGAYFFLPSRQAVDFLSAPQTGKSSENV